MLRHYPNFLVSLWGSSLKYSLSVGNERGQQTASQPSLLANSTFGRGGHNRLEGEVTFG